METKLSQIKAQAAKGNWNKAIAIASKFNDLGAQRNAILDAHTAITNPRWMIGLGKDVDVAIANGISALQIHYGI